MKLVGSNAPELTDYTQQSSQTIQQNIMRNFDSASQALTAQAEMANADYKARIAEWQAKEDAKKARASGGSSALEGVAEVGRQLVAGYALIEELKGRKKAEKTQAENLKFQQERQLANEQLDREKFEYGKSQDQVQRQDSLMAAQAKADEETKKEAIDTMLNYYENKAGELEIKLGEVVRQAGWEAGNAGYQTAVKELLNSDEFKALDDNTKQKAYKHFIDLGTKLSFDIADKEWQEQKKVYKQQLTMLSTQWRNENIFQIHELENGLGKLSAEQAVGMAEGLITRYQKTLTDDKNRHLFNDKGSVLESMTEVYKMVGDSLDKYAKQYNDASIANHRLVQAANGLALLEMQRMRPDGDPAKISDLDFHTQAQSLLNSLGLGSTDYKSFPTALPNRIENDNRLLELEEKRQALMRKSASNKAVLDRTSPAGDAAYRYLIGKYVWDNLDVPEATIATLQAQKDAGVIQPDVAEARISLLSKWGKDQKELSDIRMQRAKIVGEIEKLKYVPSHREVVVPPGTPGAPGQGLTTDYDVIAVEKDTPIPGASEGQIKALESQLIQLQQNEKSIVSSWMAYGINITDPTDSSGLNKLHEQAATALSIIDQEAQVQGVNPQITVPPAGTVTQPVSPQSSNSEDFKKVNNHVLHEFNAHNRRKYNQVFNKHFGSPSGTGVLDLDKYKDQQQVMSDKDFQGMNSAGFVYPVQGGTVHKDPRGKNHYGLDIFAPTGTLVKAPFTGEIIQYQEGGTRNTEDSDETIPGRQPQHSVKIKLDKPVTMNGKKVGYVWMTHLSALNQKLRVGSRVTAGDLVGNVGTAGGHAHLHISFGETDKFGDGSPGLPGGVEQMMMLHSVRNTPSGSRSNELHAAYSNFNTWGNQVVNKVLAGDLEGANKIINDAANNAFAIPDTGQRETMRKALEEMRNEALNKRNYYRNQMGQQSRENRTPSFTSGSVGQYQDVKSAYATVGKDGTITRDKVKLQGNLATHKDLGWTPFKGGTVTMTSSFRTADRPNHTGIDLSSTDHRVASLKGGKVKWVGTFGDYGKTVFVETNDGFIEMYAHLENTNVAKGGSLAPGDLVGMMGRTGRATGEHLHFEVWTNNDWNHPSEAGWQRGVTNPVNYLRKFKGTVELPGIPGGEKNTQSTGTRRVAYTTGAIEISRDLVYFKGYVYDKKNATLRSATRAETEASKTGVPEVVYRTVTETYRSVSPSGQMISSSIDIPDRAKKEGTYMMLVPAGYKVKGQDVWELQGYYNNNRMFSKPVMAVQTQDGDYKVSSTYNYSPFINPNDKKIITNFITNHGKGRGLTMYQRSISREDIITGDSNTGFKNGAIDLSGTLSINSSDYSGFGTKDDDYGYGTLRKDPKLREHVHIAAQALGVPAVWIADQIAMESEWSHTVVNSYGYRGYFQVKNESAYGITQAEMNNKYLQISRAMVKYHKAIMKEVGGYRNFEEFIMGVWGGGGGIRAYRKAGGGSSTTRFNYRDANTDWDGYRRILSKKSGRKYKWSGARMSSRMSHYHDTPNSQCPVCNSMVRSGSFQTHFH